MARRNKQKLFTQLTVTGAGAKGKSLAKAPDGTVVFMNNAVPGDVVDVQIFKKRRNYYKGKAVAFHQLSDKRVEPHCVHFGVCGGCKWQAMGYEHQLAYKQDEVVNNLLRIGKVELPDISPIRGSEKQYYYRNKMEFSFSNNRWLTAEEIEEGTAYDDRNALGFHIPGMWDKILDLKECHLQAEPSNSIRLAIRDYAVKKGLEFFDPRKKEGLLRTLMIRTTSTGQLMVLIQFFKDDAEKRIGLLNYVSERFPQINALLYTINPKGNDTIYDLDVHVHSGTDHIVEEMEGLQFTINAKSFYQTNSEQAYALYKITREFAGLSGQERVYDLYTGTGTIALFIARLAKQVIGIEAVPEAIEAAEENARQNGVENTRFYAGDMKKVFTDAFIAENGQPNVIITDPPRDGMHKEVVEQILRIAPEKVVYVSCNSATQARDLTLMDAQYKVTRVQPVDMFPQTFHVENVVLLERRG